MDMLEIEGKLEKKRRDLALRSDFNMRDAFKLFCAKSGHSMKGMDVDDLAEAIFKLGLHITKNEVFVLFYKLDRDSDGIVAYSEFCQAFIPKQHEYSLLL